MHREDSDPEVQTWTQTEYGELEGIEVARATWDVGLTILWHPEWSRVGDVALLPQWTDGPVEVSRLEPRFAPPSGGRPAPLGHPRLSRSPLLIERQADGGVRLRPESWAGRLRVDGQPVHADIQLSADEVERGVVLVLKRPVALILGPVAVGADRPPSYDLVGESLPMVQLRRDIERLGPLATSVLLKGESGTGKELVARALQGAGPRRRGPFRAVNLGALASELGRVELFGAKRGAYTGANHDRDGYFQQADGGTLFLDELGEAAPEIQVMLLRALETKSVEPVGATGPQPVDVRLVAATDADLDRAIEEERFKAPLLHRLAGYELILPPLRQRIDDLGRLIRHFLDLELRSLADHGVAANLEERGWLSGEQVAQWAALDWPGNVRQLRNVVHRLVVHSHDLLRAELPPDTFRQSMQTIRRPSSPSSRKAVRSAAPDVPGRYRDPDHITADELGAALARHGWAVAPAARDLQLSETSLRKLKEIHGFPNIHSYGLEDLEGALARYGHDWDAMSDALRVSKRALKLRMKALGLR